VQDVGSRFSALRSVVCQLELLASFCQSFIIKLKLHKSDTKFLLFPCLVIDKSGKG
jgi:hypothetical protein